MRSGQDAIQRLALPADAAGLDTQGLQQGQQQPREGQVVLAGRGRSDLDPARAAPAGSRACGVPGASPARVLPRAPAGSCGRCGSSSRRCRRRSRCDRAVSRARRRPPACGGRSRPAARRTRGRRPPLVPVPLVRVVADGVVAAVDASPGRRAHDPSADDPRRLRPGNRSTSPARGTARTPVDTCAFRKPSPGLAGPRAGGNSHEHSSLEGLC